jgi:hypothetical protein
MSSFLGQAVKDVHGIIEVLVMKMLALEQMFSTIFVNSIADTTQNSGIGPCELQEGIRIGFGAAGRGGGVVDPTPRNRGRAMPIVTLSVTPFGYSGLTWVNPSVVWTRDLKANTWVDFVSRYC